MFTFFGMFLCSREVCDCRILFQNRLRDIFMEELKNTAEQPLLKVQIFSEFIMAEGHKSSMLKVG